VKEIFFLPFYASGCAENIQCLFVQTKEPISDLLLFDDKEVNYD